MQFISVEKSPSYVFQHGSWEVGTGLGGGMRRAKSSLWLQFRQLDQPFQTTILPAKASNATTYGFNSGAGVAWGALDTYKEATRLKREGFSMLEEDEEGAKKDVTEEKIIEFLFSHPKYGREFVGIGRDGEELTADERWLVPEGDITKGGVYCRLCKQHIATSQGINRHVASNKHQEHLSTVADRDDMTLKLTG